MIEPSRDAAQKVIDDCRSIARFSEHPENITRTFLSAPMIDVHRFLRAGMESAGMSVRVDAMGNLRGLYPGVDRDTHETMSTSENSRQNGRGRLLIGSHVDTVPDAGAFDGVLGVVLAIALVGSLRGRRLDFDIEVIAFSEEEGVRFGVPFIGSRALIGDVDEALLARTDAAGVSVERAIRDFGLYPQRMGDAAISPDAFGFVEFHIEQGPVLASLQEPVRVLGVVDGIAGQTRLQMTFKGAANHAGTTPMNLRRDALAGAAEWILAVEAAAKCTPGMVATVGEIAARPGACNVVPGAASLSLDLRHAADAIRKSAVEELMDAARAIADRRRLQVEMQMRMEQPAVAMNARLAEQLESAVRASGSRAPRMVSGAGHDAMVMARKVPAAMLFVASPGGVSHHPDESVRTEDVQAALDAGLYFLNHLQRP